MNTLADRLNMRMDQLGLTQEVLAKAAGVSQSAINKLCTGKAQQTRKLVQIADALKVRPEWLETGRIPMLWGMDDTGFENVQVGIRLPINVAPKVPVVGTAQLGDDGFWAEIDYPAGSGDGVVQFKSRDDNAYAIRCKGASMMPRIRDGEFVVVEPNRTPIPGDDVLVKHVDGRVMVKRFLYERDGMIHLLSINESFPPHAFQRDQIEVFHPVGGIAMTSMWLPE